MTLDWILIALIVLVPLGGVAIGGGKVIHTISEGIVGKILTLIVFYFTFGLVLNFAFVQDFLITIAQAIEGLDSKVLDFLVLKIRLEIIVFAIIFLVIVAILRRVVANLIKELLEIDNKGMKVVNKILGGILSLFWIFVILLIVFQVLYMITGESGAVYEFLSGSFLRLDDLYLNNPLNAIVKVFDVNKLLG